jgi:hypothetical protein
MQIRPCVVGFSKARLGAISISPLQIASCYWRSNLRNMLGSCEKGKNGTCHRMTWVDQWASEVEGSASLDFLVLHEVWSDHLLENNFSHIHKLSFYHFIRWPLIFSGIMRRTTDALSSITPSVSLFMSYRIPSWHFYMYPRHDHIPSHDFLHGSSIFLDNDSTLTYYS